MQTYSSVVAVKGYLQQLEMHPVNASYDLAGLEISLMLEIPIFPREAQLLLMSQADLRPRKKPSLVWEDGHTSHSIPVHNYSSWCSG